MCRLTLAGALGEGFSRAQYYLLKNPKRINKNNNPHINLSKEEHVFHFFGVLKQLVEYREYFRLGAFSGLERILRLKVRGGSKPAKSIQNKARVTGRVHFGRVDRRVSSLFLSVPRSRATLCEWEFGGLRT